ncbi:MAG: peptidylprolyl isomerase [Bacteroidia bacterium]|nr:peptidylprolyl isomerase [Bacteroidia bacterium]
MSFSKCIFVLVFVSIVFSGCSSVPRDVLATIDGTPLSVSDYEEMFLRTRLNRPHNDEEKREFLTTLTDFRVKVAEAERLGLQNDPDFIQEVKEYRDNLALSFLYEQRLAEPALRTLYDRRLEEIKIQQLVVKWAPGEGPDADTSMTWEKARVVESIIKASGLPFDSLVTLYSDDGGKARTRGVIGWIIAGTTFPWLDDMIYDLQPGQVTPHPLRTVFGYHFFKVLDRKPARQRLRPAQILYRLDLEQRNDTTAGVAFLGALRDSIQQGLATFEELAMRHSQDTVSGPIGGDLGWMTRGTNIEANFEDALLNLQVGEVSRVVRTPFGLHLIKMLAEEAPEPLEKQKDHLRRIYRNERFATDFLHFTTQLRRQYNYAINANVVERLLGRIDSSHSTSTPGWDKALTREDRAAYLLRTDIGPVTVDEAVAFIKSEPTVQMRRFTAAVLDTVALMLADRRLALHESRDFENSIPEFRRLLQEYRSTALITRLEEREVWNAIQPGEEEMQAWWRERKSEFTLPPRVKIAEIFTHTEKMSMIFRDSLYAGYDFGYLASRYTQRPGYFRNNGEWDFMDYNQNELARTAAGMAVGQIAGPIPFEGGFSLIKVLDKHDAREQTWEEARSSVIGMYKSERAAARRAEWVRELRARHQVVEYPGNLDAAFPPVKMEN